MITALDHLAASFRQNQSPRGNKSEMISLGCFTFDVRMACSIFGPNNSLEDWPFKKAIRRQYSRSPGLKSRTCGGSETKFAIIQAVALRSPSSIEAIILARHEE